MKTKFKLIQGDTAKQLGTMTFNGKFTFELSDGVDLELWNKIGFIKLEDRKIVESENLFKHLNARLPITLRDKSNNEKISYIKKSKLQVASDSFYLEEFLA